MAPSSLAGRSREWLFGYNVEFLEAINSYGLPGWLVISASILVILRAVGLLDPIVTLFRESAYFAKNQIEARSAAEQSEQVALQMQMARLQGRALEENSLLLDYIINDVKETLEEIRTDLRSQKYHVRDIETKLTMMIQIISEWYDRRKDSNERHFTEIKTD